MRTIAIVLVLVTISGCGQPDIARERSYIAHCAALGAVLGNAQFEQCRSSLELLDRLPQLMPAAGYKTLPQRYSEPPCRACEIEDTVPPPEYCERLLSQSRTRVSSLPEISV